VFSTENIDYSLNEFLINIFISFVILVPIANSYFMHNNFGFEVGCSCKMADERVEVGGAGRCN